MGDGHATFDARLPAVEVIDRQTQETIERLIASGLLLRADPTERALSLSGEPAPIPLTAEETERCQAGHSRAQHALRRACVLGEAGFDPECHASLVETCLHLAGALAILHRLPEPASLKDAFTAPHESMWRDSAPILRNLLAETLPGWRPVAKALNQAMPDVAPLRT